MHSSTVSLLIFFCCFISYAASICFIWCVFLKFICTSTEYYRQKTFLIGSRNTKFLRFFFSSRLVHNSQWFHSDWMQTNLMWDVRVFFLQELHWCYNKNCTWFRVLPCTFKQIHTHTHVHISDINYSASIIPIVSHLYGANKWDSRI